MTSADPPPAPGGPAATFQERFAALARDWRAHLPGRLEGLPPMLQACRDAPGDDPGLQELYRQAHMLAGSAGTFGLHALGDSARALDIELQRLMAQPARQALDFDPAARLLEALLAAPRE
jgi:periplasmic divalent cation tolerance protein